MIKLKNIYYITLILVVCLFTVSPEVLLGAGSAGTSAADFLELGIGSRPLSMGEAFTSEINDINSIYYNPAGLATLKYPMVSVNHQELILDSRFENVSFAYPLYNGYLGVSNSLFWVPPFDKIDIDGNTVGKVDFYNGAFTAAYGYNLEFMYVGGSIKYIYQKIDSKFYNSVAFDVGVLKGFYMYSPFKAPVRNFHVGLSIQNLGVNIENAPLPRLLRFGISYKLTHWFGFNVDFTENIIDASDLYDFTYGFDESFRMNIGMELIYMEIISLRSGYRFNDGGTYSLGIGFHYTIKNVSIILDTSFSDSGTFGPNYSFNISFKLIPKVITIDDKRNAAIHYNRGIQYFIANDVETALTEFKICRDYDPYYKNIEKKIRDIEELIKLKRENEKLDEELKKKG
ncbi:PorV/PorQ family protein [Spirochaetota bacterium]